MYIHTYIHYITFTLHLHYITLHTYTIYSYNCIYVICIYTMPMLSMSTPQTITIHPRPHPHLLHPVVTVPPFARRSRRGVPPGSGRSRCKACDTRRCCDERHGSSKGTPRKGSG